MSLPFSWQLFYLSSVGFVLGLSTYYFTCPEILRHFRDYSEFKKAGYGGETIADALFDYLKSQGWKNRLGTLEKDFVLKVFEWSDVLQPDLSEMRNWEVYGHVAALRVREEAVREAFVTVRALSDGTKWWARWFCLLCYSIAGALLVYVAFQNFIYVVSPLFRGRWYAQFLIPWN